jgi:MEDS: MEthanogen/methylotroph, DcmR Sensory domain/Histidine kinase-like ATPase domain
VLVETGVREEPRGHLVQFYESDEQLVRTAGGYVVDGLRAGQAVIVIATRPHRRLFETAIAEAGIDVDEARGGGRLIMLDAHDTLDRFLVDGWPDGERFDAVIGTLVRQAAAAGTGVRAFGEMVALLWDDGRVPAALELEALWNRLGRQVPFSLFCSYPAASVAGDDRADALAEVCDLHSHVIDGLPQPAEHAGTGTKELTRTFPLGSRAPRDARHFVVAALRNWGHDELVESASLVTTELVTNAVMHARSDAVVTISSAGDTVRVSVRDYSRARPTFSPATAPVGGRGLRLIAALTSRWGTDIVSDGKIVWSLMDRRSQVAW